MIDIVTRVRDLKAETPGITWDSLARLVGYSNGETLRSAYRYEIAKQKKDSKSDNTNIEFFHTKGEQPDWRKLAERAGEVAEERAQADPLIRSASISMETDKPIGIVFSGDWHLGDVSVDYKVWLKDMESIIAHPQLYLVDLGDDRQNMRSFKDLSGVLSQVLSPREQAQLIRGLVDELTGGNKLICKVNGNHDVEFDERLFGEAIQNYLLEKMKAPRFRNKGLLFLELGDQVYTIYVFHKTRFRSIYRAAHGAWREWQFGYPADIVAGGHDHTPAFEMMPSYSMARDAGMNFGGLTFLIKVGTYQDGNNYGWKYFHNGGRPEAITIVLWPNEHRMQAFLSVQDAIAFLDTFSNKEIKDDRVT